MGMLTVQNPTAAPVKFRLAGAPGEPVLTCECPPGGRIEVPAERASAALLKMIAPKLVVLEAVIDVVLTEPEVPSEVAIEPVVPAVMDVREEKLLLPKRRGRRRKGE